MAHYGLAGHGMQTLNGNLLCAIDTETTGLVAGHNDIVEFACIPLDAALEPYKTIMPFTVLIRPKQRFPDSIDPVAVEVNGLKLEQLLIDGLDPWRAVDAFEHWVDKLKLAPGKKIAPLAFNWRFDSNFISDWLCPKTFEMLFHHHARDAMPIVHFLNDKAEMDGRKPPFPKHRLQEVRHKLGIEQPVAHRAFDDALTTARVYKKLLDVDVSKLPTLGSLDPTVI